MIRRVIQIDQQKCNGCGACAGACHEGAIAMVNGKAQLMRDDFCDGLGDCLPACPTEAITFVEREAKAYDEAAVLASKQQKQRPQHSGGCPGHRVMQFHQTNASAPVGAQNGEVITSRLRQWPCQIKLVPIRAPYFSGADLLIAADCTAYAYGEMHRKFMEGRITVIGCPKLDSVDYSEKLTSILTENDIRSVTLVRMEVPCCGGLEMAAGKALRQCGKDIPFHVVTISLDGKIMSEE